MEFTKKSPLLSMMKGMQFRVFFLISMAIFCTALAVFAILYLGYYKFTLQSFKDQSRIVSSYAQRSVPLQSFTTLEGPQNEEGTEYSEIQKTLNAIRQIANIWYLYTVRLDAAGNPVYVIDGLDPASEDFRHIGDSIEPEIAPQLKQCLQGTAVETQDILRTSWGSIFLSCWPLTDEEGNTPGAVVMEFDARVFIANNTSYKLYALAFSVLVALLFLGIVIYSVRKNLLKPLLRIRRAAECLAQSGFNERVPVDASIPELRDMQEGFNTMATQISSTLEAIREADRARLLAEDASQAKSAFLANMSHEIRTPMNGVLGMLHLVLRQDLPDVQRSYLEKAEKSARRLLSILNDILDFSKIEAHMLTIQKVPFSLASVLDDVFAMHKATVDPAKLVLNWNVDDNVPPVLSGDELRLHQIVSNLVSNAVKFTSKGSVRARVRLLKREDQFATIALSVSDTGIGLTTEQSNRLFVPFSQADDSTTRRFGGTGLGLSIVKCLVEMMSGTIRVDSVPEQGTTFTVVLTLGIPANGEGKPESSTSPASAKENLRGLRVLVAEDNEINQLIIEEILRAWGCEVEVARDGFEAVTLASAHTFDLILMDIQMPRMDGLQATSILRQNPNLARVPIVAMTAHAMEDDFAKSLAAGMQGHLTKPIVPDLVFETVRNVVKASRAASSSQKPPREDT